MSPNTPNTPDSPNTPMNDDYTPNPQTDARIAEAFRDLSRRAGTVPVDRGPHTQAAGRRVRRLNPFGGPNTDNRLIPALAFVVVAMIAGFGAWQLLPGDDSDNQDIATEGDLDGDGTTDGTDDDSDGAITTDDTADDADDGTGDDPDGNDDSDNGDTPVAGEAGARYRVDTTKVEADTSDPFLNVRRAPDAGADLLAKLPPNYRGIRLTGETTTTDDGGTWFQVQLLDPVEVNLGEPLHGGQPTGWVNAAFLIPLTDGIAVGTDEVPACVFEGDIGTSGRLSSTSYVSALESARLGDNCLRVVVTLTPGSNPFAWDEVPSGTGPATTLPAAYVSSSGGNGVTFELGENVASAWPNATETDDGVYIARSNDGSVDLVVPTPVSRAGFTPMPQSGILVIDMEIAGEAPTTGRFVALTDDPAVGAGTVTVTGLARPFEANLGVSIVDDDGRPVAALYSGSAALGTLRGTEYAVQTNDWTEAWGRFAVTAADLQPGSYRMLLDGEGGVDTPSRTTVAFTVTDGPIDSGAEPNTDDQSAAQALVRFAQGGAFTDLDLADEVTLSLGVTHQDTFSRAELADRANWVIDVDEFEGFSGPFEPLELLVDGQVEFSTGPIPHCAGPPVDWPTEWDALSQVNIEPVGIDSCIQWYGISLFRNNTGEVEVIVLDLFGP